MVTPPARRYEVGSRAWILKRLGTSVIGVPESSGVYVLTRLDTFAGLPVHLDHIYVGRSDNLQRRLTQHTPQTETHLELRDFLVSHQSSLWVWYTTDLGPESARDLEVALIRHLRPRYNTVHKPKSTVRPSGGHA